MSDILLTHSYILKSDQKQLQISQPYAPLGTLYAASVLKEAGYDLSFYDPTFSTEAGEILPVLLKERPSFLIIYDDVFSYLSKMCLISMREIAFEMIRLGRALGSRVIIFSTDAIDNFSLYISNGASFVIIGEGEITLKELMNRLSKNPEINPEDIPGIAFMSQGIIRVNKIREPIDNPDILPFPMWNLIDVEDYRAAWMKKNSVFAMNMVATRGCPYKCVWCAKPVYGNHYSSRSPENVVKEMIYLKKTYNPDQIWFADDIFGLKPGWISKFSELLRENNLYLPFTIQSRVDILLNDNQVEPLAAAGCRKVWLGIESGSQKILDAMLKGITIAQVRKASALLRSAGIEQAFFIQLGFPGEKAEDIRKSINLLTSLMPDDIGISVTYPLPGTKFHEAAGNMISGKTNWNNSDDLTPIAVSEYPPAFYKPLHRFIHKFFRYNQALFYLKTMIKGKKTNKAKLRRISLMPYYLISSLYFRMILKKEENVLRKSI